MVCMQAREMMGLSRKMLQTAKTTGFVSEGRGRPRAGEARGPAVGGSIANPSAPPDKRPERRAASLKAIERPAKQPK